MYNELQSVVLLTVLEVVIGHHLLFSFNVFQYFMLMYITALGFGTTQEHAWSENAQLCYYNILAQVQYII